MRHRSKMKRQGRKDSMTRGFIKKITDKGFGFISRQDDDNDLFWHSNELIDACFDELNVGDQVCFDITDTPKGPAATNISILDLWEAEEVLPETDKARVAISEAI